MLKVGNNRDFAMYLFIKYSYPLHKFCMFLLMVLFCIKWDVKCSRHRILSMHIWQ